MTRWDMDVTSTAGTFTIREATDADADAIVAVLNTDAPQPTSAEAYLERERQANRQPTWRTRWALEDADGQIVGTSVVNASQWVRADEHILQLVVAPHARSRGYGAALLAASRDAARAQGAARLRTNIRDAHPDVRAWAERQGFTLLYHKFESTLDLAAFDERAHGDVDGALARAGIQLTDMVALGGDDANWTRLHDFFADRLTETPDMKGMPRWTREQVRQALLDEDAQPEWTVVARRGEQWLGFSILTRHPRGAYNFITAVRPEARGVGLGRALKVEVIRRARAAGFTSMLTHNLSVNASMLAVNRRLGFEPRPGLWVMTGSTSWAVGGAGDGAH
ncbi:GNAT family N-acetyltransferase [Deinococcus pimensis]|uniref:GNAT family N-acetyltransferase n=1 Tax=Deinococcus pimensis TaxID=309888 RepID=UPI00146FB1BC|nr:GNAT family N-acetyltransferase [Deinococcus pimensis]